MGGHRSSSLCAVDKNTAVTNGKFRHYSKDRSVTPRGGGPKTPPEIRKSSYSVSRSETSPSPRSRSYSSDCRRRRHYDSPSRLRDYYCDKYRSREKPKPNRCIGVFGLSVFTTQHKIRDIFDKFGPIERIQMVVDQQTGRSRGFCFIYYENLSDAKAAKEECCGIEVDDRRIRVDFSITQRPHTPTPGIYMGHTTRLERTVPCRSHVHRFKERYCHEHVRHHKRYRSRSITPIKTSSRCRTHYHKRRKMYCSHSRSRTRSRSRSPISRRPRYC